MFLLGLLLPISFVVGLTGATIPTQWALLSMTLPLTLWRAAPFTALHLVGLTFLAWAFLSSAWALNYHTSVLGLWYITILALAFWYGSTQLDLRSLWLGLASGLTISTGFALAQTIGFTPVLVAEAPGFHHPGLLYSHVVQAYAIALVLIACVQYEIWLFIPPLALGLILANARGAYLILAVTALARYVHWLAALTLLVAGAFAAQYFLVPSDSVRLQVWGYAIRGLSLFGWGPFAFNDIFYFWYNPVKDANIFLRAEFAHNDYLQLWFEYGIGSLAIFTIYGLTLTRTSTRDWPIFFGFCVLAGFWFPLYHPLTAFMGAMVAGHLLRDSVRVRTLCNHWRPRLLSWADHL
jgi:hypothetical protein